MSDVFKIIREINQLFGISSPESDEDLVSYNSLSKIKRGIVRQQSEINRILEDRDYWKSECDYETKLRLNQLGE